MAVGSVLNARTQRLLLGFESIGASCEFGLVQRRYRAKPLGLFRWNDVPVRALVRGLAEGLAGMGDPDTTDVVLSPLGEYQLRDRRWGFAMHTFLYPSQIAADVLHAKMCRRVAFLRDKFMDDLRSAEKIFVYRSATIDDAGTEALHDALRAHGPAQLFVVRPNGVDAASRTVKRLRDDICVGFIRPGNTPKGWDVPFRDWVHVCRKAATAFGKM